LAKLTQLKPKLKSSVSRLAPLATGQRDRSHAAWRAWYRTADWRELKRFVHRRDDYVCQICGNVCAGKYPADDSPVADHKKPHRGDRKMFFDPQNVWTICKMPCHDQVKQREEQGSLQTRGVWD